MKGGGSCARPVGLVRAVSMVTRRDRLMLLEWENRGVAASIRKLNVLLFTITKSWQECRAI